MLMSNQSSRLSITVNGLLLVAVVITASLCTASTAKAYNKESKEVRDMVEAGKAFLEKNSIGHKLGAKCLSGLVFIKEKELDHPLVKEALKACQEDMAKGSEIDVYSNGIAIIFLSSLDAKKHSNLLKYYMGMMLKRQKQHGGWGYDQKPTGDTSQSQYGCLGFWEAFQKGVPISTASIDGVARWLIATQDPSGAWGYQGKVGSPGKLVKQHEITCSMVSAAMGSLLICADLVGILQPGGDLDDPLPDGISMVSDRDQNRPRLRGSTINKQQLLEAVRRGDAWMDKNYKVEIERYTSYYLYALERHKSLQAQLEGDPSLEPEWYNNGVEYLMKTKYNNDSWNTGCGPQCDTAFSILFLIRSMQSELEGLGDGGTNSGRGIPMNLERLEIRGGQLVQKQTQTKVDMLLEPMTPDKLRDLDQVIQGNSTLELGDLDEKSIRRFKQLVRSGEPAARIVAVKALGQTGDFDHVPTLIYALGENDPYLVREARDALRFISRRFDGFGLKDEDPTDRIKFSRASQMEARAKWIKWYKGIRPDVPLVE